MTRPRVGITVAHDLACSGKFSLRYDYVRAVQAAGAVPFLLAPGDPRDVDDILECVDGIVLSGGTDVDPELFGQERHPSVNAAEIHRDRDAFEIALCRAVIERDMPMLAICRGAQVLNVAAGGTLIQDIRSMVPGAADHDPGRARHEHAHEVALAPGTQLFEILGRKARVPVNSIHHQAVGSVGPGLRVSARSIPDDVVEAIEAPRCRFVVGVQWHPESFAGGTDEFAPLFAALLSATLAPCRA